MTNAFRPTTADIRPARREFLIRSSLALAGSVLPVAVALPVEKNGLAPSVSNASAAGVADTSASPHVAMRSLGLSHVRWTRGFWADRVDTCRRHTLPHLWRVLGGTEFSQFYQNFLIAAGEEKGRHRGAAFNDGELYKWLEAASAVCALTNDKDLDQQLDEVIRVIARAQRLDGYLHTPVLIKHRNGETGAQPFQEPLQFEAYNLGHLLTAACIHYRATGKTSLLTIARKAADHLDKLFQNPTPALARCAVCPSHYMGIVELYRTTREPRYLELAKKLIAARALVVDGTDDNQDRIPFPRQTEAVGHAVRANYLYAGVADLYAETGDRTLLPPLQKIWNNVAFQKMYITGGCGALYDGASPDGSKNQKQIGRVHQAYGRPFQLPSSTAHNETCAGVAFALWNWRMLQITGDASYADMLELVLYNSLLAGVSLDGKSFFYTNTLRQLDRMPTELRWSRTRQPFISTFCCPPNLARTIAETANLAYCRLERGIALNLYGSSVLETELGPGARLKLTQETDYPWDGRVKLRIDTAPGGEFALQLRIPGWAKNATLNVNGQSAPRTAKSAGYLKVRRVWSPGDIVELNLPMPAQLLQSHPLVEETRNQVAVKRGPLVYCLESCDLDPGVRLSDVLVPGTIELQPRKGAGLLAGVTILQGKAIAVADADWSGTLYREWTPKPSREIDLKLIPYFAWGNRGPSEMTVWLPLRR
jgi:DUF1680 family protein